MLNNIQNYKVSFAIKLFAALGVALGMLSVSAVQASSLAGTNTLSLQNLERERAALIQDMLSPTLSAAQRQQSLMKRTRHLTDMERMVMRDERLLASDSPLVKKAFNQYDLTFLVHAGAEKNLSAGEQWLNSVNVSNRAILSTSVGFRK